MRAKFYNKHRYFYSILFDGVFMFKVKEILKLAQKKERTIVFPEVSFSDRTFEAVMYLRKKRIVKPLLVGDASALVLRDKRFEDFEIVNPVTFPNRDKLVKALYEKRKAKGLTLDQADELEKDPYYFATLLVECGYADGMVAGAECATATAIRPALQIIKAKKKNDLVSSCMLICGKNKFTHGQPYVLADCGLIEKPDSDTLANIATQSVRFAQLFGVEPKVAFLSHSTKGSAKGEDVERVRSAFDKFRKKEKDVVCDGEIQLDAAIAPRVAKVKCAESPLNGHANVLIFPDLQSGNLCYKAMQYFGRLTAIGPILMGMKKPVNDLSRGCTVEDIIIVSAITALQCEDKEKKEQK